MKAFLSGLVIGTLAFGPFALQKPQAIPHKGRPPVQTWVAIDGVWMRCDPSRVDHSDQAVRWTPATNLVEIKEHGQWKRPAHLSGVALQTNLPEPPHDGKDYTLVARAGVFEIGADYVQLESYYEPTPPGPRTFRGHLPLAVMIGDSTFNIDWYTYSFQEDWATVADETQAEYEAKGYKPWTLDDFGPLDPRHEAISYRRGLYIEISLPLEEDSIELIKDCRFRHPDDLTNHLPRSPGWITAIIAHPHKQKFFTTPD